jgi:hypothetical protein
LALLFQDGAKPIWLFILRSLQMESQKRTAAGRRHGRRFTGPKMAPAGYMSDQTSYKSFIFNVAIEQNRTG